MDDSTRLDDYEKSANDSTFWQNSALVIQLATEYLEEEYNKAVDEMSKIKQGTFPTPKGSLVLSQMLYFKAMTLEQLLKALFLKNGNRVTDGNGKLIYKTHNLIKICNDAQFDINHEQEKMMQKLTDCINHWGRYPVPTNYKDWRKNMDGIEGMMPVFAWSKKEGALLNEILELLFQQNKSKHNIS